MKRVPKVSMTRYAGFVSAYYHPDNRFSLKDQFVIPSDNDWQFLTHLFKFELVGLGHERGCRDSQAVYETAYQYSIDSFFLQRFATSTAIDRYEGRQFQYKL